MMQEIRVNLAERSYDIAIGSGMLDEIGSKLRSFSFSPNIALVSNPTVFGLYGERVLNAVRNAGFDCLEVLIDDGEEHKNLISLQHIYHELLKHRLDRSSALIALGGGVIGDIAGFAASTYMRGIAYVQVPTTLLAQVDSSVGGKTGVNHELGKNMIGTFWQPRLVWIDVETLKTLPGKEVLAGLSEVIKYGVIYDGELFDFLDAQKNNILNLQEKALIHIIKRSCEIKADVVSKDEREAGLRAILNYGHTIGHAVETVTRYTQYLHGEAVAIGMHFEALLAHKLNLINADTVEKIKKLIEAYGLPSELPSGLDRETMLSAMQLDKKAKAGELTFILPEKIGSVKIERGIDEQVLREILKD